MLDILALELPTQGLYCVCQAAEKGYIQHFFTNIPAAAKHIEIQDAAGHTMYMAQASYKVAGSRKGINASHVRSFIFDVDAGEEKFAQTPDKAYLSQAEACVAIKQFALYMDLPLPTVVNSGNGLYAKWHIDEDIPATQWKVLAEILKRVAYAAGFKQDPARTSDVASILRPVGSTNRKKGGNKPVRLIHRAEPMPLKTFTDALEAAAKKSKIPALPLQIPTQFKGLNDEFTSGTEGPSASLLQIANRCAQVRAVRDSLGNVDEPTWYNFLGMARFTVEGEQMVILHEWSSGHPDYSPAATKAKVDQHISGGYGPTTCEKFGSDNPAGCIGCAHANSIKSPILLGRPDPVSIATEEEEQVAPAGFKRDKDGMFYTEEEGEGQKWHRFYPYDIYVTSIARDTTVDQEMVTVRHQLPVTKEYVNFTFRSALVHDAKALLMELADHSVQTTGAESRKQMLNYINASMAQMRSQRQLSHLHSQMGWKDGETQSFVLGDKVYRQHEEPMEIGFARNVPEVARSFTAQGSLDAWKESTKYMGMDGMEPFAFAFLAGAFGAPLMKFTGYAGAMVALVGDSGIGKTLLGEWIMSVYGDSQKLILLKDDTKNFTVQRLGIYGSLPLYVDEISNIEGQELSDLVYKITQGRDKGRLTRGGVERNNINSWNTIAVASSNHSLVDKLSELKTDASAEINRLMEIDASAVHGFGREVSTAVYHNFRDNYGVAGPMFIEYITNNQDQHKEKIAQIVKALDLATDAKPEERFWSAVAGVAIYGGLIAQKLGLIKFAVAPILQWVKGHIMDARACKVEQTVTYTDYLGQFLDSHMRGVIVTTHNGPKEMVSIIREPMSNLVCRIEEDTKLMFISRSVLKSYLEKTYGSYSKLKKSLEQCGALLDSNKRKVLGSGTYFSGSQQPVWMIDLRCRELGYRTLSVVRDLEIVKKVGMI